MTIRKLPEINSAQIAATHVDKAIKAIDSAELILRHYCCKRDQWKYLISISEQLERISQTLKDNQSI